MKIQIFYSWQSDTDSKYNRFLIEKAIKKAIENLAKDEANVIFEPILDRAGSPKEAGSPNIVNLINKKLRACDIFIADLTYVAQYPTSATAKSKARVKGSINSNVAIELGQAKAILGDERIIKVMNSAYGSPEGGIELPFDIAQDRNPSIYLASSKGEAKNALSELTEFFTFAIGNIIRDHTALLKERFKPFTTYTEWGKRIDLTLKYHSPPKLTEKIQLLAEISKQDNSIVRISGLSGVGKTRFVYEALNSHPSIDLSGAVLYYDASLQEDNIIADQINSLISEDEFFIFVVDNVTASLHARLGRITSQKGSKATLITIAPGFEEELQFEGDTVHIQIEQIIGKQIAIGILENRFGYTDTSALQNAIKIVGGFPSLAVALCQQPELDIYSLSKITSKNWVDTVLGYQSSHLNDREVLRAIAVFGFVGYEEGVSEQTESVAKNNLLIPFDGISDNNRIPKFRAIVNSYLKKGIIGKKGRFIFVQPDHLAVQLASEWWSEHGPEFNSIYDSIRNTSLPRLMFDNLRMLSRLNIAQDLVIGLCRSQGALGRVETILSEEGADFLNSLADINPDAVAACLARELLPLSISQLEEAKDSRRSLVWALEKLCRYESTFNLASRTLLRLAVAENELINNNATAQFCQLYQFKLAGTEVNYTQRLDILNYESQKNDEGFDRIIILACARALNPRDITRIVFGEEQYQKWDDFSPTNEELRIYWEAIASILMNYAGDSSHSLQTDAAKILVQSLTWLEEFNSVQIILPKIVTLIKSELIPFKNAHSTLRSLVHSHRVFLREEELAEINVLLGQTAPASFTDRFKSYVFDFADSVDLDTLREEGLKQRAIQLVPEFIGHPELWETLTQNSYGKNPFHTNPFFHELAVQLKSAPENIATIISYLLEGLRSDTSGQYTVGNSLTGFLSGVEPDTGFSYKKTQGAVSHTFVVTILQTNDYRPLRR